MLILRNFIKTNRQLCEIYFKSHPNTFEALQNQCCKNVFTSNSLVRCSSSSSRNSSSSVPINNETSEFHDPNLGTKIYHGTLSSKMKAVKIFSLSTSAAGLAAQPILLEQGAKLGGTAMAVFLCGFAGFFTFVTPLFLHFITKKYVTEIHYSPAKDEYTATTISLFLRKNLVKIFFCFFITSVRKILSFADKIPTKGRYCTGRSGNVYNNKSWQNTVVR